MDTKVRHIRKEILSDNHYQLDKVSFEYQNRQGEWQQQWREVYDRGNGATALLYNTSANTVILIRQFRVPTYLNQNHDGMLWETCAGLIEEGEDPETCIRREIEEETGYRIQTIKHVFDTYMSPGAVTEKLFCYVAPYESDMKIHSGGGLASEQEDIEVVELSGMEIQRLLDEKRIEDAKTLLLLQYALLKNLIVGK